MADQGPRKGAGGSTRQGIYCFTADGQLLAYKNAGQAPDVMREVFRDALRAWEQLPEFRRRPGALQIPDEKKQDANFVRTPPKGGVILKVHARILDRNSQGDFVPGTCESPGGDRASRDHVWLTEAEWRSLLPADAKAGDRFPLPEAITLRLALFHLVDNTRGEPPLWKREELRSHQLQLTVMETDTATMKLRLEGSVLLATHADPNEAKRGYEARLLGHVHYNKAKQALERMDLVALGDFWGEAEFTRGARKGRKPFGVAFELVHGTNPADRIPPQGARMHRFYFENRP